MFRSLSDHPQGDTIIVFTSVLLYIFAVLVQRVLASRTAKRQKMFCSVTCLALFHIIHTHGWGPSFTKIHKSIRQDESLDPKHMDG